MKSILFKVLPLLLLLLLCLQPLASEAAPAARNTRQQAHTALTVSATRAREASAYVSRVSSGGGSKSPRADGPSAFQDCMAMMAHSADRLQRSVAEMSRLGRAGSRQYALHLSNLQTWVSSALTDQDMCLDSLKTAGVSGRRSGAAVAKAVRVKVAEVRKYTSTALSLVNRMN